MSLINKLEKKDEHTLAEMFYGSQAYYRVSQLHLQLKFIEKAHLYMEIYENLQNDYLNELENVDFSVEINIKQDYLKNQILKRKAWFLHNS